MEITAKFLKDKRACDEAVAAWKERGKEKNPVVVVTMAMDLGRFDWANWLIVRCMTYKQYVSYAIFAAEQVIGIYEKKHPGDECPRNAIEAARKCLTNPSKENKAAAYDAAAAAYAADAYAAYADAAAAAADAAYAAADAADAAYAAYAATYAAEAAEAARKEMQKRIIEYGIKLMMD